jgi:CDP-glycerol glycerophosphotransferase (TagB/SpsB family)
MDEPHRVQFIQKYESKEMLDTYMRVKEMKCRRLMYMPTFRDKNVNYINEAIPSWEDLNEVLMQNNVCLYLKLHRMTPTPRNKQYSNIIVLDSSLDIYPLLPLFDGLISDYSSIMSDFGLLNRPVVLYTFDLEQYISLSRPVFKRFWDVYERLTILHNYEELKNFILMKELPASYFPVADYYDCPQDMDATKRLINRLS